MNIAAQTPLECRLESRGTNAVLEMYLPHKVRQPHVVLNDRLTRVLLSLIRGISHGEMEGGDGVRCRMRRYSRAGVPLRWCSCAACCLERRRLSEGYIR